MILMVLSFGCIAKLSWKVALNLAELKNILWLHDRYVPTVQKLISVTAFKEKTLN